jgi:mono/diheme cytochrome c family protein
MMELFRCTEWPLQDGKDANPAASEAWEQLRAVQAAYADEAARRPLPPTDAQKDVRAAFKQLFGAACAALEREHASLLAKERNNLRTLTAR